MKIIVFEKEKPLFIISTADNNQDKECNADKLMS
jgi:hypothetical protein